MDPNVSDAEFGESIENRIIHMEGFIDIRKQRFFIANSNLFISGVARNLPVMMFLLLPFFALILYLLQFRRGNFFVEHLIHGLHLHSFAYFIYGMAILLLVIFKGLTSSIVLWSFVLVSVYAYFSFKRVYHQGWGKTFFKFFLLGFVYLFILLLGFISEIYITLLLF